MRKEWMNPLMYWIKRMRLEKRKLTATPARSMVAVGKLLFTRVRPYTRPMERMAPKKAKQERPEIPKREKESPKRT
jgi:hypothetical protein